MIRTIVIPEKRSISFDIPANYLGRQIEVIAFAKDEGIDQQQPPKDMTPFTVLHAEIKDYKFNRDEANER